MYAVVDIETTGNHSERSCIIEIAVLISDGVRILDRFASLVNPGRRIPAYITALTGIDTEMVSGAPYFHALAPRIYELLKDKIFVAHNVNFDYGIIKNQLRECGMDYQARKLCTVRLSRQIIPGLPSYALGSLSRSLKIPIPRRHRAEDDAVAAAAILHRLLKTDAEGFIEKALKRNSREATLPPNLPRKSFEALPEKPGVYYFLDHKGRPIYVGKAKNIKKRVASHFTGNSELKAKQRFFNMVHDVEYEVCGNELIALLLECEEIKRLWPEFNRSQKMARANYGVYIYEDRAGFLRLSVGKADPMHQPAAAFKSLMEARSFVQQQIRRFRLCPKLCGLQKSAGACLNHAAGLCSGACNGDEAAETYNERVRLALEDSGQSCDSYVILGSGREHTEASVVLVENGRYLGFGYIDRDIPVTSKEEIKPFIKSYHDNQDAQRILQMYLRKSPSERIIAFR